MNDYPQEIFSAASVVGDLINLKIYDDIRKYTQERDLTAVTSAISVFAIQETSKSIKEHTQARSLLNVRRVENVLVV